MLKLLILKALSIKFSFVRALERWARNSSSLHHGCTSRRAPAQNDNHSHSTYNPVSQTSFTAGTPGDQVWTGNPLSQTQAHVGIAKCRWNATRQSVNAGEWAQRSLPSHDPHLGHIHHPIKSACLGGAGQEATPRSSHGKKRWPKSLPFCCGQPTLTITWLDSSCLLPCHGDATSPLPAWRKAKQREEEPLPSIQLPGGSCPWSSRQA